MNIKDGVMQTSQSAIHYRQGLSCNSALKQWSGCKIVDELAAQEVLIRRPSTRGIAEESPGADMDVRATATSTKCAGVAQGVARLRHLICVKGCSRAVAYHETFSKIGR
jgi:RNA-splicing ligase RtcB